jgi:hypothetical protein
MMDDYIKEWTRKTAIRLQKVGIPTNVPEDVLESAARELWNKAVEECELAYSDWTTRNDDQTVVDAIRALKLTGDKP